VGAPNADSSALTTWSFPFGDSAAQQEENAAQNKSLAVRGRVLASSRHARSAGLGLCFSISTDRRRIHSSQSSFVDRDELSQARRKELSSTEKFVTNCPPPASWPVSGE